MAASYENVAQFAGVSYDSLFDSCVEALETCGFEIEHADHYDGRIYGRAKINIRSFAEVLEVEVNESGTVYMKSRCSVPTQIVDWGKNRKNVEQFFEKLTGLVGFV